MINKKQDMKKNKVIATITNKTITHNTINKISTSNRKYLDKIVDEFDKNRRQI